MSFVDTDTPLNAAPYATNEYLAAPLSTQSNAVYAHPGMMAPPTLPPTAAAKPHGHGQPKADPRLRKPASAVAAAAAGARRAGAGTGAGAPTSQQSQSQHIHSQSQQSQSSSLDLALAGLSLSGLSQDDYQSQFGGLGMGGLGSSQSQDVNDLTFLPTANARAPKPPAPST